jgi:Gpi18-like mannosyltransferase
MSWREEAQEIGLNVVLPFLVTRFVLVVIGLIAIYYVLPLLDPHQPISSHLNQAHGLDKLIGMWARFDSGFYIGIAQGGYQNAASLQGMSNWAFFPLYPLLIRLFAFPFGVSTHNAIIAGLFISTIFAIIGAIFFYKLVKKEFNSLVAQRSTLYLLLFPMSFYYSAVYTEGLFIGLSIACFYFIRQHRWWLAGLLGACAALTRSPGALLVVPMAWECWQVLAERYAPLRAVNTRREQVLAWLQSRIIGLLRSLNSWHTWFTMVAIALIPTGTLLFCIYGKIKVGTFLPFVKVEENGWHRYSSNPITVVWQAFQHPDAAAPWNWNFYMLNIIVIVVFWLLLLFMLRRLSFTYSIYTLFMLYLPLASGTIMYVGRLYMVAFPVYLLLALWSTREKQTQTSEWRHTLITCTFTLLLAVFMLMFVIGIYSIA